MDMLFLVGFKISLLNLDESSPLISQFHDFPLHSLSIIIPSDLPLEAFPKTTTFRIMP
jgi:hypothetical protein